MFNSSSTDNLRDLTDYLLMEQRELEKEDDKAKEMLSDLYLVMILFDIFGGKHNIDNVF